MSVWRADFLYMVDIGTGEGSAFMTRQKYSCRNSRNIQMEVQAANYNNSAIKNKQKSNRIFFNIYVIYCILYVDCLCVIVNVGKLFGFGQQYGWVATCHITLGTFT